MRKFETVDQQYLSRRKALAEELGQPDLWSVADHWPLYCGIANLGRYMAIADLLRSTLEVPGHVAEFGSWRGANLMLMAKLLQIYDPHGSKAVHCFDSFAGLDRFHDADGAAVERHGAYKGSLEQLNAFMELYGLQDLIEIHRGHVEETLPALLEARPEFTVSFVYCDLDLYDGTSAVLHGLHGRLARGGLFVLDEWNDPEYPGETVAVREFLARHGDCYEMLHVQGARQPSLALRRVKM